MIWDLISKGNHRVVNLQQNSSRTAVQRSDVSNLVLEDYRTSMTLIDYTHRQTRMDHGPRGT